MDRSLATLLRSLQTSLNYDDAYRLLPIASSLLCRLSNPLNVKLLSSQLLENDILYPRPIRLVQAREILTAFYTAAQRFKEDKKVPDGNQPEQLRSTLAETEWITAVVQGAGDGSPRWRHALMIGGLLLATCRDEEPSFSGLRQKLEAALVRASNIAIQEADGPDGPLGVILVLSYTFHLLSDVHRAQLNSDSLLPILVDATFFSPEGLEHGYWLGVIDQDVRQANGQKFTWSTRSPSAGRVQEIKSRPLVSSLNVLARLLGHTIDQASERQSILRSVERISEFAKNLAAAWRQNKLSEIDQSEETQYLDQETTNATLPSLLHLLRDTVFATIITLRSVLGRLLVDPFLASDTNAPTLAAHCLHILRNMYFISHRFGQTSLSPYLFVNFIALDVLNQYPSAAENMLASIRPAAMGKIPVHPLERLLDLFFFNTAEHFTLTVSAASNENLLNAAMPYIQAQGDHRLGEIYEAAHSLALAVFTASQNADIVPKHVPVYVENLMSSFPHMLNPRQFRLAIKSIIKLAAPPSSTSRSMPLMQAVILDLLAQRFINAAEAIFPPDPTMPIESAQPTSERSALLLSAIDSLPFLPNALLEDWLLISADLLHKIQDPVQKNTCQQRLWEVLSNGEMDVERAAVCVAWWNSKGGRKLVMFGELPEEEDFAPMSGGLGLTEQSSKL